MAGYKVAKIDDIEGGYGGAFKKVRATLGISAFGIQVIDIPPNVDALPGARPQRGRPGRGLRRAARVGARWRSTARASRSTPST